MIASEDELPYPVSPITPLGMVQADALSVAAAADAMSNGAAPIVVERVFHRVYSMRPFARLASRHGYAVEIHLPNSAWALDYETCLQHTRKPVQRSNMELIWRQWELVGPIEKVLQSRSPSERLAEAKRLLADVQYLKAENREQSNAYREKLDLVTKHYEPELRHLIFLGYFDCTHRDRVNQEYACLIAKERIEAQHGPDSPAALRVVQQKILAQLNAD